MRRSAISRDFFESSELSERLGSTAFGVEEGRE
jgi:hypothetical protein